MNCNKPKKYSYITKNVTEEIISMRKQYSRRNKNNRSQARPNIEQFIGFSHPQFLKIFIYGLGLGISIGMCIIILLSLTGK